MDRKKTLLSKYISNNDQTHSKIAPDGVGGKATVNACMRSLLSAADITSRLWTRVRMRITRIPRKSPIRSKRMFLKKRKKKS